MSRLEVGIPLRMDSCDQSKMDKRSSPRSSYGRCGLSGQSHLLRLFKFSTPNTDSLIPKHRPRRQKPISFLHLAAMMIHFLVSASMQLIAPRRKPDVFL